MSLPAMVWSIEQQTVSDSTARHVLLCLANRTVGKIAFPSVETLQRDSGLSERTIRYKLDHLESLEIIKTVDARFAVKYVGRADRIPKCYEICIPDPWLRSWDERQGADNAPRDRAGCKQSPSEVQVMQSPGATTAPKLLPEHVYEPPQDSGETSEGEDSKTDLLGGGDLDLSFLPDSLQVDVYGLVRSLNNPQAWIDLLVARLWQDEFLPANKRLRNPLRWLGTIITSGNADFSAAKTVARKRATRALEAQQSQKRADLQQQSEFNTASDIAEAQALLASLSEHELLKLAEDAVAELSPQMKLGSHQTLRAQVLNRSLGTALMRAAVLNAIRRHWREHHEEYA